jgi:hypothetical protein
MANRESVDGRRAKRRIGAFSQRPVPFRVGWDTEMTPGAVKFDTGKPRISLVAPIIIRMLAKVFEYGAEKYGEDNWRLGIEPVRLYDAAMRHLLAWMDGERLDESGLSHLAHALWNVAIMLLTEMEEKNAE